MTFGPWLQSDNDLISFPSTKNVKESDTTKVEQGRMMDSVEERTCDSPLIIKNKYEKNCMPRIIPYPIKEKYLTESKASVETG